MIGDLHFLRPWWLLALIPCALLLWAVWRRNDAAQRWNGIVAPHLLPFLLKGGNRRARFTPLHLLALGWLVAVLAIAGPTSNSALPGCDRSKRHPVISCGPSSPIKLPMRSSKM
jgi:hypothetical protein